MVKRLNGSVACWPVVGELTKGDPRGLLAKATFEYSTDRR